MRFYSGFTLCCLTLLDELSRVEL
ncbi:hypothetical protein EMIT043CA1_150079 [Pseudomonas brassicacearum]